jgi:hypothetical protein
VNSFRVGIGGGGDSISTRTVRFLYSYREIYTRSWSRNGKWGDLLSVPPTRRYVDVCSRSRSILDRFFIFSSCFTEVTACLGYKNCIFGHSVYLTENTVSVTKTRLESDRQRILKPRYKIIRNCDHREADCTLRTDIRMAKLSNFSQLFCERVQQGSQNMFVNQLY